MWTKRKLLGAALICTILIVYTPIAYADNQVERSGTGTAIVGNFDQEVHLLLITVPSQATYTKGQSVTLTVTVFNEVDVGLESTLTLTITGPSSYYSFDFDKITVAAGTVDEYSFSWDIPNVAGTYVVEVSLIPSRLTAYDAAWLEAT